MIDTSARDCKRGEWNIREGGMAVSEPTVEWHSTEEDSGPDVGINFKVTDKINVGIYILDSPKARRVAIYGFLFILSLAAFAALASFSRWGGGTTNFPPRMIIGVSNGARISGRVFSVMERRISVGTSVMMASDPIRSIIPNISANGPTVFGRAPSNPFGSYKNVLTLWTSGARAYMATGILAEKKASRIWLANHLVSASVSNAMAIIGNLPRSPWIKSHCSWLSIRGNNFVSSSTRDRSALSARSLASAAIFSAAPSLSLDRRWSSASLLLPIRPNWTSAATPIATNTFANVDPHCSKNESYWGWYAAMATSARTPITTRAALPPPQRSHDSPASFNAASLAFITSFVRRHAGKEFDRGFLIGLCVGALMFALLIIASLFYK